MISFIKLLKEKKKVLIILNHFQINKLSKWKVETTFIKFKYDIKYFLKKKRHKIVEH